MTDKEKITKIISKSQHGEERIDCPSCMVVADKILSALNEKHPEEKQEVCNKCNGEGSYRVPVSSPIMAPYGKDDTTSVPCDCKISGGNKSIPQQPKKIEPLNKIDELPRKHWQPIMQLANKINELVGAYNRSL
jgi:hypothetical protein